MDKKSRIETKTKLVQFTSVGCYKIELQRFVFNPKERKKERTKLAQYKYHCYHHMKYKIVVERRRREEFNCPIKIEPSRQNEGNE